MRTIMMILFSMLFLAVLPLAAEEGDTNAAPVKTKLSGQPVTNWPFVVYTDSMDKANHYYPSGWMGDMGDIELTDKWKIDPMTGISCLQIRYSSARTLENGWAGIYWQNPEHNWGNINGGYDLTGAKQLWFYARGENGGEMVEFKCGGIQGEFSDSMSATTVPITLTKDWKLYTIDLDKEDMTYVNGGFNVVFSADGNPDGATIYLDEILYSRTNAAVLKKKK